MHRASLKPWLQIGLVAIALIITIALWPEGSMAPAHGQINQATSFRLSRIETDLRNLRAEIQQLETALSRVQRLSGDISIDTSIVQELPDDLEAQAISPTSPTPSSVETGHPDLMFDQLATLVIETRQDMFVLQEQVSTLERMISADE